MINMTQSTIGRIVLYRLSEQDATAINKRRSDAETYRRANMEAAPGQPGATGHQSHVGNSAHAGDQYPAVVVRVFDEAAGTSNLKVLLDGNDTYWATSRVPGDTEGTWSWPVISR